MIEDNLEKLEAKLKAEIGKHRKLGDNLVAEANIRNNSRAKEQEVEFRKEEKGRTSIYIAIYVICAVAALIFYKAVYGLF